jgi:putative transposase
MLPRLKKEFPWLKEDCYSFLAYKLDRKEGKLIGIDRFFPSSKKCSCCGHVVDKLPLDIRQWNYSSCSTHHQRDGNAALNIRAEGIRILSMSGGNPVPASGACVRPNTCKGQGQRAMKREADTYSLEFTRTAEKIDG